jgi:hypothetical protein
MVHKFCENHLTELYEAIKAGKIAETKKIEHELSKSEECVACAYALKARGEVKTVLLEYLKNEGLSVETPGKVRSLSNFWLLGFRIIVPLAIFFLSLLLFRHYVPFVFSLILSFTFSIVVFVIFNLSSF